MAATDDILTVEGLAKRFPGGRTALDGVDLSIRRGEIFALLGPNGAGKTTLISIICGLMTATAGRVTVDGHDHQRDYRQARKAIGLVPQELGLDIFATVWNTVSLSRGLFGLAPDRAYVEGVLRELTLLDRKAARIRTLSGGMKRRVLIAKALAHAPAILFLDEPTAGVDVALRREMWEIVRSLRAQGTTVILTTHYIEEAEEMADRIGVINKGRIVLVDDKARLMERLGKRSLRITLDRPLEAVPDALAGWGLERRGDGRELVWRFTDREAGRLRELMHDVDAAGLAYADLHTARSSLEEIFVELVGAHA